MTLSCNKIITSLDGQLTEFQELKDLVTEHVHLLQQGEFDQLQASCVRMIQIIEQIDRASAKRPSIPPHLIQEKEIALRITRLKDLIGEIEAIRVSITGKLVEIRQAIQEDMNQLTTGVAATKQYYQPKQYRGARYFDRSQ
jgi:hypothetical protein